MNGVRYREGWELVLKELACLGLVYVCVIDIRSSSHLELLISRRTEDKRCKIKIEKQNECRTTKLNAILNIRTGLKRDNIIKQVMIMTEFPDAVKVTM